MTLHHQYNGKSCFLHRANGLIFLDYYEMKKKTIKKILYNQIMGNIKNKKVCFKIRSFFPGLLILTILIGCQITIKHSTCPQILSGVGFLGDRYNPQIDLLNESPNVAPNMYWLTNDNVLAAYTLAEIGSTESIELASSIQKGLDIYGYKRNGFIEVVWGEKIDFPPKVAQPEKIFFDKLITIQNEAHTGSEFLDWQEYSNLGFFVALNYYNQGKTSEAIEVFQNTLAQFDGIGFNDKAFNNQYETYKIALAIFTARKMDIELNNEVDLLNILLSMQSENGGFYTHYLDRTHPVGDTNSETTAFGLLALLESHCGKERGSPNIFYLVAFLLKPSFSNPRHRNNNPDQVASIEHIL